ncbi:MurR/RpiR family transcriptional regulator [Chelatococcus sp. SYSU_G07232]|uniref:MurR/RpiR family transcriptional regulator n=1 Tax=Chelatococcus albus TaxID=3047466 RepID=A0ABT7AJ10_9HYPH|nr:MurR/RpiR family transcriptional regulator [Chelatococcus sp. SYSU_G07232]MDJ1159362.1 MurR/RpiR family transcriptional regulator [Chelatococcus sp. SYSU_G07232]
MADDEHTIAERIRGNLESFTASEKRAAHALLAHYPMAGLETVAEFAARAGVSAPSVLRFVSRLGFVGYPDFQRALREELEAQLKTPLMKASPEPPGARGDRLGRFAAALRANLSETFAHLPDQEFEAATALIADRKRRVHLVGGRFTDALAAYMAAHLRILRPGVVHLSGQADTRRDQLLDIARHDVLVVFDVRRYQENMVALAAEVARRGGKVVLVTDQWLSPVARSATHILSARIEAPSNWDSNVALLALVEALVAAVTERLWPEARRRIEEIERLRQSL